MAETQDIRYLVRIANTDLKGDKPLYYALSSIKGINVMFAHMVCRLAGLKETSITGHLTDDQIALIEQVISQPSKFGAPAWMLNRRKDYETGANLHFLGGDLKFAQENDIKRLKKIKSWRGMRHIQGLPCRGQRTRSNFRKSKSRGKGGLGVHRAKVTAPKPTSPTTGKDKGGK